MRISGAGALGFPWQCLAAAAPGQSIRGVGLAAMAPNCRSGSGNAPEPVDGQAVLVEQSTHDVGESDEVRDSEVGVEPFGGLPVLVEEEGAGVLDVLVEVVVDEAVLLAGGLDEGFQLLP